MSFLRLSRPAPRVDEPAEVEPLEADAPETASVELYTVWGHEMAWVASGDERTSDWLNTGDTIAVRGLHDLPLDAVLPADARPPAPEEQPTHRLAADVLFVIPPDLPPKRHLRLHRRIVAVRLEMASFRLVGRVHIRPGAEAGDYLLRGNRRFVPITDVELTYTGEPTFQRRLPVVIINVTHVTLLDRGAPAQTDAEQPAAPVPAVRPERIAVLEAPSGTTEESILSVRAALEQLAALSDDGLITRAEQRRKRAEILARI